MNRLKVIRAERRLTQFKLALLSGITQSRLSYFENSLLMPTDDEKKKLAGALGMGVEEIFPEEEVRTCEQSAATREGQREEA
jgi:transcriptional regulator with XRE-family HTH domain